MVETGAVGLLVLAATASLFTARTIGAGSSGATPFAPAVGANALSTMRAAFVVGILGFLGAVLQGAKSPRPSAANWSTGRVWGRSAPRSRSRRRLS